MNFFDFLIENGADFSKNEDLVHYALINLNEDGLVFKRLVELGFYPNAKCEFGRSLLILAALFGYFNAYTKLIDDYGANDSFEEAFHMAIKFRNPEIVDLLIQKGVNIHSKSNGLL